MHLVVGTIMIVVVVVVVVLIKTTYSGTCLHFLIGIVTRIAQGLGVVVSGTIVVASMVLSSRVVLG